MVKSQGWGADAKQPHNTSLGKYSCPHKYCFFWHMGACDEAFKAFHITYDCTRKNKNGSHDWYEPCEPELEKDGLPLDFFMKEL